MNRLKNIFVLTDEGYDDLKRSVIASVIQHLSYFLPIVVTMLFIKELLNPLITGNALSMSSMLIWLGVGVVSSLIMLLAVKNAYYKNHIPTYHESKRLRIAVAEHLKRLPMTFFNSKDLTEMTSSMMADCAESEKAYSSFVPGFIGNIASAVFAAVILAFFDWKMTLAVFASVPLAFGIQIMSLRLQRRLTKEQLAAKNEATLRIQEYLEGIKVVKANSIDGISFSKLEKALETIKNMSMRLELTAGIFVAGADVVLQIGVGILVLLGTWLFADGQTALLTLLLFFTVVLRIYEPLAAEIGMLSELTYMKESLKRLKELMEAEEMTGENIDLTGFDVEFKDVSFSYGNDSNSAIKKLSFTAPQGKITALVGPSGSGKTTVARLIARFWNVSFGQVLIGGKDISKIAPEKLNKYISIVFQDVVLFNDTVFNNIKIGNESATDEQVMAAAKAAQCDEFISKMENGYNTVIAENGKSLSGGERQRISIARALLKNAPILLLDEATASLDPENEEQVQKALTSLLKKGTTVIVIAHRLRTVIDADKIVVLKGGKLEEEGNHALLMEHDGLYKRLYDLQQESLNWSAKA